MDPSSSDTMKFNIKFDNLGYKTKNKIILEGVTGEFRENSVNVIMGSSGSGSSHFSDHFSFFQERPH